MSSISRAVAKVTGNENFVETFLRSELLLDRPHLDLVNRLGTFR